MREIARTALVPYTPEEIFALVDDFARYPEFLPWVSGAEIVEQSTTTRVGRLKISRSGLNEQFTTRNVVTPPGRLEMKLLDGPFRVLEGVWTFDPIVDKSGLDGAAHSQNAAPSQPSGTRIALTLRFEFKNRVMDLLLAPKFAASCDTLVDAFAKRAREVYGSR